MSKLRIWLDLGVIALVALVVLGSGWVEAVLGWDWSPWQHLGVVVLALGWLFLRRRLGRRD